MNGAATIGWRTDLATIGALMARAKNELLRVPAAAIPGVLAPTIFFLGINGVFGALTNLTGFTSDSYAALHRPGQHAAGRRLHRAPRPGSTWPATSNRAGSTGCSSPPRRAGCCSPARSLAAGARALIPATFVFAASRW